MLKELYGIKDKERKMKGMKKKDAIHFEGTGIEDSVA